METARDITIHNYTEQEMHKEKQRATETARDNERERGR